MFTFLRVENSHFSHPSTPSITSEGSQIVDDKVKYDTHIHCFTGGLLKSQSEVHVKPIDNNNSEVMVSVEPFQRQVAGHGVENNVSFGSFLRLKSGRILKPYQKPPKGTRECTFYEAVHDVCNKNTLNFNSKRSDVSVLKDWIPKFHGLVELCLNPDLSGGDDKSTNLYIVLSDLTSDLRIANVMDIKIGSQTWFPGAPKSKQIKEDAGYVGTRKPFAFSVSGMLVNSILTPRTSQPLRLDKAFGKDLKSHETHHIPHLFFDVDNCGLQTVTVLIEVFIRRLKSLREAYEQQRSYELYASSVLFAYDAERVGHILSSKSSGEESAKTRLESCVVVKIIDFAHAFPTTNQQCPDHNFLSGIDNLISIFTKFISSTTLS